jgi:Tfp pilus assembly protein PilW
MSGIISDNQGRSSGLVKAAGGGGKILQVQSYSTDAFPSQSVNTSWNDIASFLVAITPTATDSKIWVNVSIGIYGCTSSSGVFAVERAISGGATAICPPHGVAASARLGGHARADVKTSNYGHAVNFGILDVTHNTTSEITYQLQWNVHDTAYINRSHADANESQYGARTASGITAWEIGA